MKLTLPGSKIIVLAAILVVPASAHADVPGGTECEMQEGCVTCEHDLGGDDTQDAAYDACVAEAEADGLVASCSEGSGSYATDYYCPDGVDATAGCSAASARLGQGAGFLVSCLAALGLTVSRRARRKRVAQGLGSDESAATNEASS
jgi:hypothetical protein